MKSKTKKTETKKMDCFIVDVVEDLGCMKGQCDIVVFSSMKMVKRWIKEQCCDFGLGEIPKMNEIEFKNGSFSWDALTFNLVKTEFEYEVK